MDSRNVLRTAPTHDAPVTTARISRRWRRPSNWIAVGLLAASLAMIVFSLASVVLPDSATLPNRPTIASFLAICCIFVALPTVGAVLAILRPGNPIGWLFLLSGAGFTMGIFATEYVVRAVYFDIDLPGVVLVDWIGAWAGALSISLAVTWIPLVFPDGHLPGPRWRPVAWAAAALVVVGTIAQAIVEDPLRGYGGRLANPLGVGGPIGEVAVLLAGLWFPAQAVVGLLSLASLIVRFRRSRDVERQQLKWFLFAVLFFLLAVVTAIVTNLEYAWYAVLVGLASLPVAAGMAVLRYRLYDIDRIISRTVSYASVTGVLVVTFAGAILLFQALLAPLTSGNTVAVAASTLIVAGLFQPLRRRVQRIVDQRFNRARYNAQGTLNEFSERLRYETDIEAVTTDLAGTASSTVAPTSLAIWLRPRTARR